MDVTRSLLTLGWLFVVLDLVAALALAATRGGDAATRGIGQGVGIALAVLAALAALLLWAGRAPDRGLLVIVGGVLAAAPLVVAASLTFSRQGLGLIYPSLRKIRQPGAPVLYAYPDAVTKEAALALVYEDYAKFRALLHASPGPDLTAHDERGESLLGLATNVAIVDGSSEERVEVLRQLIAAGARPRADDLGPQETLIELLGDLRTERKRVVLEVLLDAGLDPNTPTADGQPVLFFERLAPEAARLLIARGANRLAPDTRGGAMDWSPVTYHADLRNWATALALLESGVPRDHGTPPGSVLARVLRNNEGTTTEEERADSAYRTFMAAVSR